MLRSVKNAFLKPRFFGVSGDSSTGTPVGNFGVYDLTTYTDNGPGDITANFAEPFARTPVVLVTPFSSIDATGAFGSCSARAAGSARCVASANDGTATDGMAHIGVFGWDHTDTIIAGIIQSVKQTQLRPRLLPLYLSAPGTLVEGKYHASVSAVSEVSTITFNRAFNSAPLVFMSCDTAGNTPNIVSVAVDKIVVNQHDSAGSATTGGLHILVLGFDSPFETAKKRASLKCPQLQPRIIAGNITVTGGTPAATNYNDFTVADGGVGVYTLTWGTAFLREPVIVGCMSSVGSVAVTTKSVTGAVLTCQTHAGAAVDPTTCGFVAIGFDVAEQQA